MKAGEMIAPAVLTKSRLAERLAAQVASADRPTMVPLARVYAEANEARTWKVTLGKLDRFDNKPPNVNATVDGNVNLVLQRSDFAYAAGSQAQGALDPRSANPVGVGPAGSDCDAMRVEIAWGMTEGGVRRMVADWPMRGTSLLLSGSFVEVWGGGFLGYAPGDTGDLPMFSAFIVPADAGETGQEGGGELGLRQDGTIDVTNDVAAIFYVPDYARSLRVTAQDPATGEKPPAWGQPRITFEWFNDLRERVDVWIQGTSIGIPPQFVTVPPQATMVRIMAYSANLDCGEEPYTQVPFKAHWRIGP